MLDVAPTELLLVAIVALLVIGPKDLPKAMRFVGHWVGRARGVARQFRAGFDTMVREAELEEMEKKWAEENARIMREHPLSTTDPQAALPAPEPAGDTHTPGRDPVFGSAQADAPADEDEARSKNQAPVMVERPVVVPAAEDVAPSPQGDDARAEPVDKAPS